MVQTGLQVGVKILLHNKEGKFLLTRRNPKKYPEIGPRWDIIGGRITPNTPLLDNLRREVAEETGAGFIGEPKLIAAQDILGLTEFPDRHVVRLTYVGQINEGLPLKLDDESLEYKWFTGAEVTSLSENELCEYLKELLDKKILQLN